MHGSVINGNGEEEETPENGTKNQDDDSFGGFKQGIMAYMLLCMKTGQSHGYHPRKRAEVQRLGGVDEPKVDRVYERHNKETGQLKINLKFAFHNFHPLWFSFILAFPGCIGP